MSAILDEHDTNLMEGAADDTAQVDTEDNESEIETGFDAAEESTPEDDASEDDPQQFTTSTPTQNKAVVPGSFFGRASQMKSARDEEPYEFEGCTVLVTLQLTPLREGQQLDARKVFISARTHSHPPYITQARWSEIESRLPEEIKMLLQRVQENLPQRAAERRAAEEAERERQAQLQAESEKRRAAKKEKAVATKSSTPKRGKKIDLNAMPQLPGTDTTGESHPQVPTASVTPSQVVPPALAAPPTITPPPKPQEPSPQMTLF